MYSFGSASIIKVQKLLFLFQCIQPEISWTLQKTFRYALKNNKTARIRLSFIWSRMIFGNLNNGEAENHWLIISKVKCSNQLPQFNLKQFVVGGG